MGFVAVLVVGKDVEGQLARFRNFDQTLWIDEHVVVEDVLDELHDHWQRAVAPHLDWYVRDPTGRLCNLFETTPDGGRRFLAMEPADPHALSLGPPTLESEVLGREYYLDEDVPPGQWTQRIVIRLPPGHQMVSERLDAVETFADHLRRVHAMRELAPGEQPRIDERYRNGWMRVNAEGEVAEAKRLTIPGGFWFPDWRVVPGHWQLRNAVGSEVHATPGRAGFADCAPKAHIDLEAMRAALRADAEHWWDRSRTAPHEFEGILATRGYHADYAHLPRAIYARLMAERQLWRCSLIMDGRHQEHVPADWQPPEGDVVGSLLPWASYLGQLVDALPGDAWLTLVSCRC